MVPGGALLLNGRKRTTTREPTQQWGQVERFWGFWPACRGGGAYHLVPVVRMGRAGVPCSWGDPRDPGGQGDRKGGLHQKQINPPVPAGRSLRLPLRQSPRPVCTQGIYAQPGVWRRRRSCKPGTNLSRFPYITGGLALESCFITARGHRSTS
jgi:hypothetical protein